MTTTPPVEIEAMRFNDLDDYLAIVDWMKACGDTNALADEIQFRTPIMLIPSATGWQAARPGDWIAREKSDPAGLEAGRFFVLRAA